MSEPRWLSRLATEVLQDEQLAEHGGAADMRDGGPLDPALARPGNLHACGAADLPALAAAYAAAIVRNHPHLSTATSAPGFRLPMSSCRSMASISMRPRLRRP